MKRTVIILIASLCFTSAAQAWTNAIHAGIAALAEANLTPAAKAEITKILEGESVVMYASWMEDMEKTEGMEATASWYKVAVNAKNAVIPGQKLAKSKSEEIAEGTALAPEGLARMISELTSREKLSAEEQKKDILCLIHIMADLHCPANFQFEDKKDLDKLHIVVDGKQVPYRNIWQAGALTMTFSWTAREYVHQLSRLSASQAEDMTRGSVTSWINDMAKQSRKVFAMAEGGKVLDGKQYRLFLNPVADEAVLAVTKAGYRTARLLNGLFDPQVKNVSFK